MPFAQALAQFLFAGAVDGVAGFGRRSHQEIEEALFGVDLGAVGNFIEALLADHVDGDIDQIADHGFDIAADVTDFGELAGLHLHKRRIGEAREAAREFGFADTGGADHEDVFGHHFLGHLGRQFLAANTIAEGDGDGALGLGLPDHVFIEFADDLAGSQLVEQRLFVDGLAGKINHHCYSSSSYVTFSFV